MKISFLFLGLKFQLKGIRNSLDVFLSFFLGVEFLVWSVSIEWKEFRGCGLGVCLVGMECYILHSGKLT